MWIKPWVGNGSEHSDQAKQKKITGKYAFQKVPGWDGLTSEILSKIPASSANTNAICSDKKFKTQGKTFVRPFVIE